HPGVEREPKDNLSDGPAVPCRDSGQFGAAQYPPVRGQEGEALVDQSVLGAERPDAPVPAPGGVAPVLDEPGADARPVAQNLELFQGDITDSEQSGPAAVVDGLHRPPGRPVIR